MSVIAFKQNVAQRVREDKEHAKAAVRRKRRSPLLFHNGSEERPVRLFGLSRGPMSGYLTQAAIDRVPPGHIPMYTNQLMAKLVRGELKQTGFWKRVFRRG